MIYIRKGAYDCVVSIQNNVPEDEVTQYGWILIDEETDMDGDQYLQNKLECSLYDDEFRPNVKYIDSLVKFTDEEKEEYFNTEIPQEEPINLKELKEEVDNKAEKVAILNEDGTEVVKKIDLGFKMLEEEGNVTKGQLIDQDTKGVLYPETTYERILNKPTDNISGYIEKEGTTYSGAASDYGIELHKMVGKTVQETTNGYQLFDASKLPTTSAGGATVTNNGDGSFTVSGSGNLSATFSSIYSYTKETYPFLKPGMLYASVKEKTVPSFAFRAKDENQDIVFTLYLKDENNKSVELTQDMINKIKTIEILFYAYKSAGSEIPIVSGNVKPMVYQDGDGTWEQFTGGKPAPNADYPMEIKNVEIKNIKSRGKNICDGVNQNYFISYDATSFGVAGSNSGLIIPTNGAQTMTVSTKNVQDRYRIGVSNNQMEMNKTGAIFRGQNLDGTNQSKTIDTSGYKYLVVNASNLTDIQVELGSTVTEYETYKCATVETSLTLAEGDVYEYGSITKNKGYIIYDSSSDENWRKEGETTNRYVISAPSDVKYLDNTTRTPCLCNRGIYQKDGMKSGITFISSVNKCFYYDMTDNPEIDSVEAFKTWLQSHPLEVEYELATPTTEELKVPIVPSYYPYTNIWTDSIVEPTKTIWRANTTFGLSIENKKRLDQVQYDGLYVKGETYSGIASNKGIKLHKVVGKTEQGTTKGYQLFDSSKIQSVYGITAIKNDDGSITLNGTATANADFFKMGDWGQSEVVLSGTTKWKADVSNSNIRIYGINGTHQEISMELSTAENSYTGELTYFLIRVPQGRTVNNFTFKFMLYQDGDGTWEPYTGGKPAPNPDYPMEIENVEVEKIYSCNGNILDLDKEWLHPNTSYTKLNDRTIKITVVNKVTYPMIRYTFNNDELEFIKGKTIRILYDKKESSKPTSAFQCFYRNPNSSFYVSNSDGKISVPKDITQFTIQLIVVNEGNLENVEVGDYATFTAPRIIVGEEEDTSWRPYGFSATETSLTLAEGDTYENGQVTRKRKRIVFDGSSDESWELQSINEYGIANFAFYIQDLKSSVSGNYSNRFKFQTSGIATTQEEGFALAPGTLYIRIKKETASTPEAFKTWLSTHNTEVEYDLLELTTETLKVPTVPSYYPHTNVLTDNTLPTDIEWELLANSDKSLDIEALEKRIAALEKQLIGG